MAALTGPVAALGYIGLEVSDTSVWSQLAADVLGAHVESVGDRTLLRVDDRPWRIELRRGPADDVTFVGWDVSGPDDLLEIERRLPTQLVPLTPDECRSRGVGGGAWCTDPTGVRTEFAYAPAAAAAPPRTAANFVTGELGLGHVVLFAPNPQATAEFYERVLGFRVTDTIRLGDVAVAFLRCNQRHHSLALVGLTGPRRLQHLMLEVADLNSVGTAFDRARASGVAQSGLGVHTNDEMFSFYVQSPPGFTIEYGWGGRTVAEPHAPEEYDRESHWGHESLLPGFREAKRIEEVLR